MLIKYLISLISTPTQLLSNNHKSQPDVRLSASTPQQSVTRSASLQSLSASSPGTSTKSESSFLASLSDQQRLLVKHVIKWRVIEHKIGQPAWVRGRELGPSVCGVHLYTYELCYVIFLIFIFIFIPFFVYLKSYLLGCPQELVQPYCDNKCGYVYLLCVTPVQSNIAS